MKSHLHFEILLDRLLCSIFPISEKVHQLGFSRKVDLIEASGFSGNIYQRLRVINRLRNKFAHNLEFDIPESDVKLIVSEYETEDSADKFDRLYAGLAGLAAEFVVAIVDNEVFALAALLDRSSKILVNDPYFRIDESQHENILEEIQQIRLECGKKIHDLIKKDP